MVRLLALAIALALVLPVQGGAREIAQFAANAAVFLLFFLNGVRLPRHEVAAGLGNHRLLWPLVAWCFGGMALAGWGLWQAGQTAPTFSTSLSLCRTSITESRSCFQKRVESPTLR